jgi:hypothetical protein
MKARLHTPLFQGALAITLAASATGRLPAAEPDAEPAPDPNIRVSVQLVEVPSTSLAVLMDGAGGSGPKLHAATLALVRAGKARLVDSAVLSGLPNHSQRSNAKAVTGRIYPTEYEPDRFRPPPAGAPDPRNGPGAFPVAPFQVGRPTWFPAWDTRNVGMAFEIETLYDEDDHPPVQVRLLPEWVGESAPLVWVKHLDEWGDASVRQPSFTALICNTTLALAPGRFALAAVLTPQPEPPPPALAPKALVFVRADIPRQ